MINRKTVYDCINALMFNGKTISNTEFFKGKTNADKMWAEALNVTASNLLRWAEEKAVGDTMFKEITEDCKKLSGYDWRFITTALYDAAYELTQQRLEEANKPKETFASPNDPVHGPMISAETNLKYIIPWWRRAMQQRVGMLMAYMPTEEQIKWMAGKLKVDINDIDNHTVIRCFLNDYKYAKEQGKSLLTKIGVEDGKAVLSFVGG